VDVVDELESLSVELDVRKVYFWESNILMRADSHLLEILRMLKERGLSFQFQAPEGIQPNLLTPQIAEAFKEHHFQQIALTLETTDISRMKQANRPSNQEDVQRSISFLKQQGFKEKDVYVVLLIGQPNQTLDMVLRDIIRVYQMGATVAFLIYSPIPNTGDFQTFAGLFQDRQLEDLDSFLFPMASPQLTVEQMETIIRYFNFRYFPLERIGASSTNDPVINRMQGLLQNMAL